MTRDEIIEILKQSIEIEIDSESMEYAEGVRYTVSLVIDGDTVSTRYFYT